MIWALKALRPVITHVNLESLQCSSIAEITASSQEALSANAVAEALSAYCFGGQSMPQHAITAILSGHEQCVRVADALRKAGFTRDEISILMPDDYGAQELGFERKTKALEGLVAGGIMGAVLGALFGLLAANMKILPAGLDAAFVNNPANAALTMAILAGVIAAVLCGIVGLTIPEYVVHKYNKRAKLSSALISVHVSNLSEQRIAEKILHMEGAQDVKSLDEEIDHRRPLHLKR